MVAKIKYKQCTLMRHVGAGVQQQTAWIPESLAHVDTSLIIKGEPGWTVYFVGHLIRLDEDDLVERSQDYKHQRKASDI